MIQRKPFTPSPKFWINLLKTSIALHLYSWVWSNRSFSRDILLDANFQLARKIAHRWKNSTDEPYQDLEQLAAIGLLKAIERFDPSLGFRFSSYAVPKINSEIHHYIRDKSKLIKVPRRVTRLKKELEETREKLSQKNRMMNDRDIAIGLGFSDEDYSDFLNLKRLTMFASDQKLEFCSVEIRSMDEEYRLIRRLVRQLPTKNRASVENVLYRKNSNGHGGVLFEESIEILRTWMLQNADS
jgi:RNA polymerase sigma factor (sigma-70 family)